MPQEVHRQRMCANESVQVWTYAELRRSRTRRQIEDALNSGALQHVRRGVYAGAGACLEVIAAAEHGGALGCQTAARHLTIWVLDEPGVHVWQRRSRHQYRHGPQRDGTDGCGCTAHWDDGPAASAFALPSVPRILRQIYHCVGAEGFFVALESARAKGLLDQAGLHWLRGSVDRAGQDLIDFSRADAGSGLESLVRLRTRHRGWDVRTQVHIVATGRVDLLIEGWLIVETDGKENHDGRSHRHRDLLRDANAAIWGHGTLRFDYAMVIADWELVEDAIAATLATRSPAPRPRF